MYSFLKLLDMAIGNHQGLYSLWDGIICTNFISMMQHTLHIKIISLS